MKQIFILILLFLAVSPNTQSQDTVILKRAPYTLKIDADKNNSYKDEIGATAFIFPNNGMQIYPGLGFGVLQNFAPICFVKNNYFKITSYAFRLPSKFQRKKFSFKLVLALIFLDY